MDLTPTYTCVHTYTHTPSGHSPGSACKKLWGQSPKQVGRGEGQTTRREEVGGSRKEGGEKRKEKEEGKEGKE